MSSISHTVHYLYPSALTSEGTRDALHLAVNTADSTQPHPHFFEGVLTQPRLSALALSGLHKVVSSRFFIPANTLQALLKQSDPVVTMGDRVLRFEGFSSCASCYARVDFTPSSYEGDILQNGTTNVDFNPPMRAALAGIRDQHAMQLSVGCDALTLSTNHHQITEQKVALPLRWIRSMVEVQAYMASMQAVLSTTGLEVLRFLRALPRASTHNTPLWISTGTKGLISSTLHKPHSIRLTETNRIRVLEPLLPFAKQVTLYTDPHQQTCAWVLDCGGVRFTLALTAETWRGFSGEGQALSALLRLYQHPLLSSLRAQLQWQSILSSEQLAKSLQSNPQDIDDGLRILGASGLVGYDLLERTYFHRELPFNREAIEEMHPRLISANLLYQQGAVTIQQPDPLVAQVKSSAVTHTIRKQTDQLHCTCPWYAQHQGHRGVCKHILAVEIALQTPSL